jgi:hypothetical protein
MRDAFLARRFRSAQSPGLAESMGSALRPAFHKEQTRHMSRYPNTRPNHPNSFRPQPMSFAVEFSSTRWQTYVHDRTHSRCSNSIRSFFNTSFPQRALAPAPFRGSKLRPCTKLHSEEFQSVIHLCIFLSGLWRGAFRTWRFEGSDTAVRCTRFLCIG